MILNLDSRKYRLMKLIMDLDDEKSIELLENQVKQLDPKAPFWKAIRPIRQKFSLEEMIAEQNYKPVDADTFFKQADEIQMKESIEEMLEILD